MAIVKNVSHSGDSITSTNNGNIEINEGTGEINIRSGSHVLTKINSEGFTYSEVSGLRRIRIGLNPKDKTTVGEWQSKPTVDVITELENE